MFRFCLSLSPCVCLDLIACVRVCSYLSRTNPTYLFTFDHISSFDNHIWLPEHPECLKFVCHAEDLPYVFDSAEPFEKWTPEEAVCAVFVLRIGVACCCICCVCVFFCVLTCVQVLARNFNDLTGGFFQNGDPNFFQRTQVCLSLLCSRLPLALSLSFSSLSLRLFPFVCAAGVAQVRGVLLAVVLLQDRQRRKHNRALLQQGLLRLLGHQRLLLSL